MRTAFVILIVLLLGVGSVTGCKSKSKTKPEPYTGPAAPPSVAELNSAKLQNAVVPQAVQTAFGHDHASAAISDIQLHSTSTGDSFYEITYMSKGIPGTARYYANGKPVPAK